jgi:hypothetical protein
MMQGTRLEFRLPKTAPQVSHVGQVQANTDTVRRRQVPVGKKIIHTIKLTERLNE